VYEVTKLTSSQFCCQLQSGGEFVGARGCVRAHFRVKVSFQQQALARTVEKSHSTIVATFASYHIQCIASISEVRSHTKEWIMLQNHELRLARHGLFWPFPLVAHVGFMLLQDATELTSLMAGFLVGRRMSVPRSVPFAISATTIHFNICLYQSVRCIL